MRLFVLVLGVVLSPVAWSHGVHGPESGVAGGFLHPMTGIDHLLAAIGMGLWLGLQRFTRLSLPLYFAALMTGIMVAVRTSGLDVNIEWSLAATLIICGLLLYKTSRLPQALVAAVITLIFSCHFYAHIHEMPSGLNVAGYIAGFSSVTALLLVIAAMAGRAAGRHAASVWMRIAGAAIAAAGVTAFGLA